MAQCIATSRRSGERCKRPALAGATVCSKHGGSAPQVKAAAARRVEQAKASAATARLGLRVEGDPIAHMLDVIAYQAGMVAYWRSVVEAIDDDSLTWGATKVNDGPTGTTEEAKPHIAYSLLDEAQSKLVRYCAEAMKAGVAERQVRLAEQQGSLMSALQRAVLSRMLDVVLALLAERGITSADLLAALRESWAAGAAVVVPDEIRRLMSAPSEGSAR